MRRLMWLSQLFYFLLLMFSQYISSSSTSSSSFSSALLCSQHQSSALLQFKQLFSFSKEASSVCEEAGYRSYPKMKSWKEDTDCCSWDGVRCDRTKGDVIGLDLSCSWLYGTVPTKSSLFHLPHLQHLNLACNYFNHSPISSRFGQFVRLRYLNLSYSMFSGQVLSELPDLSELASLDLSGYGNVSLETSVVKRPVQNLTKQRELHLDHVNMSSVSLSSLMNLSSTLTSLKLNSCFLRGRLLGHIFCLPNLQELSLAHNPELTWFFPTVNSSNALRVLDLSYTNYLGELPKSVGKLTFLSHLIMSGCNFSEPIPTWLGNLTQLTILNLSANNFGGQMPSSLSNLKELSSLDLRANNLSGTLPMWLGNLTRLTKILLGTNSFTGQLPSSLSNIKVLTFVGLRYNNFGGRIPDFLTNLTKLTSVFLSFNQLTSQFGEFQFSNSLEVLELDHNRLYGSIPKSISNLTNLNNLDLSSNELTSIVDLDMFKNLKKLKTVDFSSNLLHGKLPAVPSSVNTFFMYRNRFSGEIPYTTRNATFLTILVISKNNLRGTVPSCLGNISNFLSVMDLRGNHFHGTIPDTFAKGNRLRALGLNDNYLEGTLPKSLVNCINLELLNLAENMINDSFPYWLAALPKLQVLILRANKFYGPIGNHKTGGMFFTKLRILDLSHNDFIGSLPTQFFEQ
ncbi:receptor-like protein 7 [Quercus lobata]|nr:receptor-like protein 7 [Quercus lobata]